MAAIVCCVVHSISFQYFYLFTQARYVLMYPLAVLSRLRPLHLRTLSVITGMHGAFFMRLFIEPDSIGHLLSTQVFCSMIVSLDGIVTFAAPTCLRLRKLRACAEGKRASARHDNPPPPFPGWCKRVLKNAQQRRTRKMMFEF